MAVTKTAREREAAPLGVTVIEAIGVVAPGAVGVSQAGTINEAEG